MNIVKINNKIYTLIYLQNNTDALSQYECYGITHVHHVCAQVHSLLIDNKCHGHLIPSHIKRVWPSG